MRPRDVSRAQGGYEITAGETGGGVGGGVGGSGSDGGVKACESVFREDVY